MIPARSAIWNAMIKSIFIPATLMLCIGILQPIPGQAATQGRNAEV